MKKRFSTIILLLALVLTMSVLGCKGIDDLGGDAGKWQDLNPLNDKGLVQCIQLHADNEQIDWWVVTDSNKILLEPNTDYEYVDSNGKPLNNGIKEGELIPKGESVYLKFKKAEDVIVWIHQENVAAKNEQKGAKDFRGTVNVQSAQGFRVDASDYREVVSQVAILKLVCDETGKTGSLSTGSTTTIKGETCYAGNWSGDYKITEVWPLSQEGDTPQVTAVEGLKFDFNQNPIEEGTFRRIVFPSDKTVILALKQPDRLTAEEKNQNITWKDEERSSDWFADFEKCKTNGEFQDQLWWAMKYTKDDLEPHKEIKATSNGCGKRFGSTTMKLYSKSALGSVYTINDSDIVDGADIK